MSDVLQMMRLGKFLEENKAPDDLIDIYNEICQELTEFKDGLTETAHNKEKGEGVFVANAFDADGHLTDCMFVSGGSKEKFKDDWASSVIALSTPIGFPSSSVISAMKEKGWGIINNRMSEMVYVKY